MWIIVAGAVVTLLTRIFGRASATTAPPTIKIISTSWLPDRPVRVDPLH